MVCDIVTPTVISGLQQYNLTATHFMTQRLIKGEAAGEFRGTQWGVASHGKNKKSDINF